MHALADALLALFATCGQVLKELNTGTRYVLDSFPVAVCQNVRIVRCKLLTGKVYRGRSASKRQWFYGVKVQVIATSDGLPVEFYVHAGREADITGLRAMAVDLPVGSTLYADNAYTDYALEDLFAEATGGQQITARQQNSKRPHSPAQQFLLQHFRKGIETTFSQLTARFPRCIVPGRSGVFSGLEFRTDLWDKYSTAAPAQRRQCGALSNTARKAYKA